jgi:hypothetical protein
MKCEKALANAEMAFERQLVDAPNFVVASVAKQSRMRGELDCFVAALLAMTVGGIER